MPGDPVAGKTTNGAVVRACARRPAYGFSLAPDSGRSYVGLRRRFLNMLTAGHDVTTRRSRLRTVDRMADTIRYYDDHADWYAAKTMGIDTTPQLERFTALLPRGASVLDAGCGSGRDMLQLSERGFAPVGVDMSVELAAIARLTTGREVHVGDLRQLDFRPQSFDGIWAMASLLHLDRNELYDVLASFAVLLKPSGVFFASVKRGHGEVKDDTGRWFTLYDEVSWTGHLQQAGFDVIEVVGEPADPSEGTGSVAPGWISSLARRC